MARNQIAAVTRSIGGLPTNTFALEAALNLGFRCAMVWRSGDVTAFDDVVDIDRDLAKIGLTRTALVCTGQPKEWLNGIRETFEDEGREVPLWFNLGFWC